MVAEIGAAYVLQRAIAGNSDETYAKFASTVKIAPADAARPARMRRRIATAKRVPIDDVEPATAIVGRFATGAMSLGSISTEAHGTLLWR